MSSIFFCLIDKKIILNFKKIKIKKFFQIPFLLEAICKHLIKILNISSEEGFYKNL